MRVYVYFMICILSILALLGGEANAYNSELVKLSAMMADRISQSGIQTVAVADFTDLQGEVTELGRFLAEHLSVALTGAGSNLAVIDRIHLKMLLEEHKLSTTGLIDPSTAKQLGRIAGVQALITGTLTQFGDSVEMTIKVLDIETARIIDARMESLAKTQAIQELLEKGITTRATLSNTTNNAPTQSRLHVAQTNEAKGFLFELQWCKRQGSNIDCHFFVTNRNDERILGIYSERSSLIDDLGNAYNAGWVTLGSDKDEPRSTRVRMFTDIPQKAILRFEGVSSQAKAAVVFVINARIELAGGGGERFAVKFSGIPISH